MSLAIIVAKAPENSLVRGVSPLLVALAVLALVGGGVVLGVNTPDPRPAPMASGAVLVGAGLVTLAALLPREP